MCVCVWVAVFLMSVAKVLLQRGHCRQTAIHESTQGLLCTVVVPKWSAQKELQNELWGGKTVRRSFTQLLCRAGVGVHSYYGLGEVKGEQFTKYDRLWLAVLIIQYHPGINNETSSEALPGALPVGQVGYSYIASVSLYNIICLSVNRTTHKCVHMDCIVNSCQGQPSLLLGTAIGEAGCTEYVPQWFTNPSMCSLTTS